MQVIEYENLYWINRSYEEQFEQALKQILQKGQYILGEEVSLFEKEFADYCGSKYCVGVASGLDALVLSLKACQLPEGSEVLVPSNTYVATILSIVNAGFIPVLVEPDLVSCNIDPELIEAKITSKTSAVLVVHLYGRPCEMDRILEICTNNNLVLIEDCAQSHGAEYKGQKTGTFGKAGAYSFYPTKNLGALGDAGAIVTDDANVYDQILALRNYGSAKKYHNDFLGFNSRMDELQAAFLRKKLPDLGETIYFKTRIARAYLEKIIPGQLVLPTMETHLKSAWHIFNIRSSRRDELKRWLAEHNVITEIHYPIPPHKQPAFKSFFEGQSYPISEEIHRSTLSLPISVMHADEEINAVAKLINEFNDLYKEN